jgi:hypothetical protein
MFCKHVPTYRLGSFSLPVVTQCTDLGVSYDNHLSFSSHIKRIITKAASRAKCILKCFVTRDSVLLTRAFCTFVRPILEFSSIIWSPYYKNEIVKIEAVQRSFTKAIANLRLCSYKERLLNLKLDSLQCRRIKADLIMCYKILHGLVDTDIARAIGYSPYNFTRGNSLKLAKCTVATEREKILH